ncbi:hypothetical protein PDJAM_G00201700 [Pangasius djambal]|uniref:Uncharacterized protein n=1 Tax=Pangasius djambal TaxID=1691987 RepID=A0ACC5Y7K4_9TELE|nr:hypothetical protein [Pangasius djambal]
MPVLCSGVLGHGPSARPPAVAMVSSHATSHALTAVVESQLGNFTAPGGLALRAGSAATSCLVGEVIAKTAPGTVRRSDSWNFAPYPSLKHGAAGPAETPETLPGQKDRNRD